jgi:hypothetical protein
MCRDRDVCRGQGLTKTTIARIVAILFLLVACTPGTAAMKPTDAPRVTAAVIGTVAVLTNAPDATGTAIAQYNIAVDATARAVDATRDAVPTRTRVPASTRVPAITQVPTRTAQARATAVATATVAAGKAAATATVAPASGGTAVAQTGAGRPPTGSSCPASHPIKGNKGSKGWIYHVKGQSASYESTKPEQCFASVQDAVAAGYRAPK